MNACMPNVQILFLVKILALSLMFTSAPLAGKSAINCLQPEPAAALRSVI